MYNRNFQFYGLSILMLIGIGAGIMPARTVNTLPHNGLPNSPAFGYGLWLDPRGKQVGPALNLAKGLKIDWLAVDFDWAARWPEMAVAPNLADLAPIFDTTSANGAGILLSIHNAPAWGSTPSGPDPIQTANIVLQLTQLYPSLLAVELFPAANTAAGWGAPPNPAAYAAVFNQTYLALQGQNRQVALVAAGLTPVLPGSGDINDLDFLQGLYASGLQPVMPIVSIRLPDTTREVLALPTPEEPRVLRHYEEVRNVMIRNNHLEGMIWLSNFSWPSGTINMVDATVTSKTAQAEWFQQAFQLMSSQLYIGAAFFSQLNPPPDSSSPAAPPSLIQLDLSLHPALEKLSQRLSLQPGETSLAGLDASHVSKRRIQWDKQKIRSQK